MVQTQILERAIVKQLAVRRSLRFDTIETIGSILPAVEHETADFLFWPDYWLRLKLEMRKLICGRDDNYDELRERLSRCVDDGGTVVLGMVSAVVGKELGITAGTLVPFCALCVLAAGRVGKEAYCRTEDLDVPFRDEK
jgi:hypothetical protein